MYSWFSHVKCPLKTLLMLLLRLAEASRRSSPPRPWRSIGFALTALLLIYVLGQLTILSNRLAVLVQELALERARHGPSSKADDPISPAVSK